MSKNKLQLSRRSLLRGAGVTLGLPWLEAMSSAAPAQAANPVRMAMLYMPNGVNPDCWTPTGTGKDFQLSQSLKPLAPLQDKIVVLRNLWNEGSKAGDGHYVKEAAILTCATIKKTPGADIGNGISMDQVAAQRVANQTPLPSLELGVTPVAIGVDAVVGYTRIYGSHIAWSSLTTPLARELNPRAVYERLYRAASGPQNGSKLDTLLLDRVQSDAKRLRAQVGVADRHRLDEYMSVMRSLEERVERSSNQTQRAWKSRMPLDLKAAPTDRPADHAEHVRLMLDMIAVAFQSDTTRVSTFMFGNAVSNVSFRFLEGVTAGHHDVSHHGKDPEKLRQYEIITNWHVQQYAYLLNKLEAMKEGDSTVLDNSMILFGSALHNGDRHDPHNLPLVLAGKGGGRVITGRHLVYGEDSPLANLYVSMLDAFGAPVERFADSTGPLAGLMHT
ncbi:DUF1552 domain-containing protein [Bryobacter aggregatus]|uniref:DUF1552 domain-containing protein n=1 Tax=Bryobacter aggregatus TaxID=360054 RepID=UPI0004E0C9C3|nr:DUF1552 domain-containing protein [Bryobacter aggregatus]